MSKSQDMNTTRSVRTFASASASVPVSQALHLATYVHGSRVCNWLTR